ncbi:hypothetical protein GDO81_024963 [Engystomops pustulosus]|uniref:Uncharacterized protein n=1 Tax=Engystomops pustulosus TaxID=76066 RepID=A0AAV6YI05_ENGPU|nr:hypothetical protein GDO81_024963 [Engystomops pustulosus]
MGWIFALLFSPLCTPSFAFSSHFDSVIVETDSQTPLPLPLHSPPFCGWYLLLCH